MRYEFASDNTAGICPEAWEAMREANRGFAPSYGNDYWTDRAAESLRALFETDCDVYFVFNGTAANSLALASLCQSYHSVVCHEAAHVETDECGAPEFFSNGTKLLVTGGPQGRLDPQAVAHIVTRRGDIHYPKPRVLSLTQPTELGTLYRAEQIRALQEVARRHDLRVHMDGARFSNAVAALGEPPRALTWEAGVDVLCLGGTKSGIGVGEAIVFFNRALSEEFAYRCKQAGQLASKMRFLAAPWAAMLESGAWLRRARHANQAAAALAARVGALPGVELLYPAEANSVFVRLPERYHQALQAEGWAYYTFIGGGVRLMCSWQTGEQEIEALASCLERAAG
jgi:threonine aldolase